MQVLLVLPREDILGKLIADETFVLPFYNWDARAGMALPRFYANKSSPLYDERGARNQSPLLMDLNYIGTDE
jgi:polyphenol oxidase